ncbi:hypothetical protein JB92DRAFT_2826969 [Gautieria morchelliformis]|nr:hypothetical protein JB92DRAFT_2826969 [Gautieria morchelliformis]
MSTTVWSMNTGKSVSSAETRKNGKGSDECRISARADAQKREIGWQWRTADATLQKALTVTARGYRLVVVLNRKQLSFVKKDFHASLRAALIRADFHWAEQLTGMTEKQFERAFQLHPSSATPAAYGKPPQMRHQLTGARAPHGYLPRPSSRDFVFPHARRILDYGQCGMWGERCGVVGQHGVRRLGSMCAGAKRVRAARRARLIGALSTHASLQAVRATMVINASPWLNFHTASYETSPEMSASIPILADRVVVARWALGRASRGALHKLVPRFGLWAEMRRTENKLGAAPEHHFIRAYLGLFAEAKHVAQDTRTRADPAGSTTSSCIKVLSRFVLGYAVAVDADPVVMTVMNPGFRWSALDIDDIDMVWHASMLLL